MTQILERVKRILFLHDVIQNQEINDDILIDFIEMYENAICLHTEQKTIPKELEFILVEATISRWRKRGSEGLESHKIDVVDRKFKDDILNDFMPYINQWKIQNKNEDSPSTLPKIRFL